MNNNTTESKTFTLPIEFGVFAVIVIMAIGWVLLTNFILRIQHEEPKIKTVQVNAPLTIQDYQAPDHDYSKPYRRLFLILSVVRDRNVLNGAKITIVIAEDENGKIWRVVTDGYHNQNDIVAGINNESDGRGYEVVKDEPIKYQFLSKRENRHKMAARSL